MVRGARWAVAIDMDEYIILRGYDDLKDFARRVMSQDTPGVALLWNIVRTPLHCSDCIGAPMYTRQPGGVSCVPVPTAHPPR
jgi:hypothetical protein